MRSFSHEFRVHIVGLGMSAFAVYMLYKVGSTPGDDFVRGGIAAKTGLLIFLSAYLAGVLLLYLTSGCNQYNVNDAGLEVRKLFGRTVVPWSEIGEITWNPWLNYVVVRKHDHRRIFYTSIQLMPDIWVLLQMIRTRSQCKLSPDLKTLLEDSSS